MDKPKDFKTITIKINGKQRSLQEPSLNDIEQETRKREEKTVIPDDRIEELSQKETAAAEEAKDDAFDWILPEEVERFEEKNDFKSGSKPKKESKKIGMKGAAAVFKKSNKKGVIPSIFFTVFFAVLLGTTFGVMLLKMVISDGVVEMATAEPTEETPVTDVTTPSGNIAMDIPALTAYMVQGGVFSTPESAAQEAAVMSEKGVPTKVLQIEGKNYIYLGLADNLESAKAIGQERKNSGVVVDAFAKEVVFSGSNLTNLNDSEKKLLEQAPLIYEAILAASTNASSSNSISNEDMDNIAKLSSSWQEIKGVEKEELAQLKKEMDGAISGVNAYREGSKASDLVSIQQHLLNFLAVYHTLSHT
ncbi:hypothetical protein [Bacillus dakarensis]|uniref:hypothetical protein n=1 Tax=Robertmurraya dakarensis TaxID=1926278 RepID=UPI00098217B4|nr:hypothetical protein [Bacillus dakarensis]